MKTKKKHVIAPKPLQTLKLLTKLVAGYHAVEAEKAEKNAFILCKQHLFVYSQ